MVYQTLASAIVNNHIEQMPFLEQMRKKVGRLSCTPIQGVAFPENTKRGQVVSFMHMVNEDAKKKGYKLKNATIKKEDTQLVFEFYLVKI
jgi:hypothetical protein